MITKERYDMLNEAEAGGADLAPVDFDNMKEYEMAHIEERPAHVPEGTQGVTTLDEILNSSFRCKWESVIKATPRAECAFTVEQHHELCVGVMNLCYDYVPRELQRAIREGVESAAELGIPVDAKKLGTGKALFSGGNA